MRHSILLFTFLGVSVHVFSYQHTDEMLYICRDHLGSITHVVSSDGKDLQELSYDPWGRPRDPDTHTLYASGEQPVPVLGRGYTGHEHLHQFNLINMNARLYDPALGRFLMADPIITDAGWGQGYNRYAYALGNPLKYVDRTGKSVSAAIFGIGAAVAALTSAYFTTVSMTGYYNIARWDFRKTSTWLGLFGGASIGVVGSFTGYQLALAMPAFSFLTTTMVTSVIASAGSLGLQAQSSSDNRTAYNPSFSISFGFGSVDILSGKFHSFGSRTGLAETFGYASGTFGVLAEVLQFSAALIKAGLNEHIFLLDALADYSPFNFLIKKMRGNSKINTEPGYVQQQIDAIEHESKSVHSIYKDFWKSEMRGKPAYSRKVMRDNYLALNRLFIEDGNEPIFYYGNSKERLLSLGITEESLGNIYTGSLENLPFGTTVRMNYGAEFVLTDNPFWVEYNFRTTSTSPHFYFPSSTTVTRRFMPVTPDIYPDPQYILVTDPNRAASFLSRSAADVIYPQ